MTDDISELVRKLQEDAAHHGRVAHECDCRPEDTANWQHYLNCLEAVAALTRLSEQNEAAKEVCRKQAELTLDTQARLDEAMQIIRWVDTWISNPVTSYSVHALDGLFGMTRDKIGAFRDDVSGSKESESDPDPMYEARMEGWR